MVRVCIWGDSITKGHCDYEMGGWVARLSLFFDSLKKNISVYNLGISGDTSNGLLKRFKYEADIRNPEIIVFSIGINDSRYFHNRNNSTISLSNFKDNMSELIKQAKNFTQEIIIVGLTNVNESKTRPSIWDNNYYYENDFIKQYDNVLKDIAFKHQLPHIYMFDIVREELEDGLHPQAKEHKEMYERVKKVLLENKYIKRIIKK